MVQKIQLIVNEARTNVTFCNNNRFALYRFALEWFRKIWIPIDTLSPFGIYPKKMGFNPPLSGRMGWMDLRVG